VPLGQYMQPPGKVKRLGAAPPIVALKLDRGGRVELATQAEAFRQAS